MEDPNNNYNNNNTASYEELKWKSAPPLDHEQQNAVAVDPPQPLADSSQQEFDAAETALLIVDVQPEYWSQCAAVRRDFPEFPARISDTIRTCRERGVAQILWVRADYRYEHSPWLKQFARIHSLPANNNNNHNFRTEVPFDAGAGEFARWEPFATPTAHEIVLPKTSWSSTSNAALMEILRASGISTVLVCGLITSVCVQHSAFGVFEAGYRTVLVTDACADRGRLRHLAALALYGDYMYSTVTSRELTQQLLQSQQKTATTTDRTSSTSSSGSCLWLSKHHKKQKTAGDTMAAAANLAAALATSNTNKKKNQASQDDDEAPLSDQENAGPIVETTTSEQEHAPFYVYSSAE